MSHEVSLTPVCVFDQALVAEQESKDSGGASIAEQVLSIMEIILDEANAETLSEDKVRARSGPVWTGTSNILHHITREAFGLG